MFYVEFASVKYPGTICSTGYDTMAEAVEGCPIQHTNGHFASIRCNDFRAIPMVDKTAARPVLKWSLSFPRSTYKSYAVNRAEQAGVRHASHRRGYVASDGAFGRFCDLWDDYYGMVRFARSCCYAGGECWGAYEWIGCIEILSSGGGSVRGSMMYWSRIVI